MYYTIVDRYIITILIAYIIYIIRAWLSKNAMTKILIYTAAFATAISLNDIQNDL